MGEETRSMFDFGASKNARELRPPPNLDATNTAVELH